jgi:hypothetical protein
MKYRIKAKTLNKYGSIRYWPQKRFLFWWFNIGTCTDSIYEAKKDIEWDKTKPNIAVQYIDYEKWKK